MANLKYKDKNTNTWQSILLTRGATGPQGPAGKNAEISLNGEINQEIAIYAPVDAGISGQVLVSKGEGQAPQWKNAAAGSGSSDVYTVDNLEAIEADPNEALSAHQGYVLNQNKVEKSTTIAGLSLEKNISASELNNSLKTISGDGSIAKIIELTYAEYKTLESNGELQNDTEYHINDMDTIPGIGAKASQVEMSDGTTVEENINEFRSFAEDMRIYFEEEYDPRLTEVETYIGTEEEINNGQNERLDIAESNIDAIVGTVNTLSQNISDMRTVSMETIYLGSNPDIDARNIKSGVYGLYGCSKAPNTSIGVLEVLVYTPDWILQRFTTISESPHMWERCFYSGTTWGPWIQRW